MEKDRQLDIEEFAPTVRERGLLDSRGREVPDPVPVAPPLGYRREPSLAERIRSMVQHELWMQGNATAETFEEANDFEDDEFGNAESPYEFDEDAELEQRLAIEAQKKAAATPQGQKAASGGVPPAKEPQEAPEPPEPSSRGVGKPPKGGA